MIRPISFYATVHEKVLSLTDTLPFVDIFWAPGLGGGSGMIRLKRLSIHAPSSVSVTGSILPFVGGFSQNSTGGTITPIVPISTAYNMPPPGVTVGSDRTITVAESPFNSPFFRSAIGTDESLASVAGRLSELQVVFDIGPFMELPIEAQPAIKEGGGIHFSPTAVSTIVQTVSVNTMFSYSLY